MYIALYFVTLLALIFGVSFVVDFICKKLNVKRNDEFYLWRTRASLVTNAIITFTFVVLAFIPSIQSLMRLNDIMWVMLVTIAPEIYCVWMIWQFIEFKKTLNKYS